MRAEGLEATVKNEGHPGEQMDFAMAQFQRRAGAADLCILGFGTNDVKKLEMGLGLYLAELSDVLDQAKAGGVPVIVLGMPWFDADLAGAEVQARLPVWNGATERLCQEWAIPFVNLYEAFRGDPDRWYNERATPKRHLSVEGQETVARLVLPLALKLLRR